MTEKTQLIPVGISSCLLGQEVRYNGGHKHSRFCTDTLSEYFEFRPYCPEVAIGMGIPRETIRLVGDWDAPRAVGTKSGDLDVTDALNTYAKEVATQVGDLCGYIFMKDSPSCGVFSTKVYNEKGGPQPGKRSGLYAAQIIAKNPLLPVEEEGRLNDPKLRENFIARVFLLTDWKRTVEPTKKAKALVDFHSRYKYFVMSHGQPLYKSLGALVAKAGEGDPSANCDKYIATMMSSTMKPPSMKGHTNVLYHMVGYLRENVPGAIRQDLVQSIEDYRLGVVPLAVPLKLVQHYLDHHACEYIRTQSYINPYPYELGLRNAL